MDLTDLLARTETIAELSDADLGTLEGDLLDLYDSIRAGDVDGVARDDVEVLRSIADAVGSVRTEAESRLSAAEAREAEVAEIEALLRPVAETPPDEVPAEGDGDDEGGDDEPEAPADPEAEVVTEAERIVAEAPEPAPALAVEPPAPAPVAPLAALASRQPRIRVPATPLPSGPRIRLLAQDREVGLDELARVMIDRREAFGAYDGGGEEKIPLGRLDIRGAYGPDRTLSSRDSEAVNTSKIEAVIANAMLPSSWDGALVASGGFCAPTPAAYDLAQISGAQRPVRDALPSFNADRGGVRFTTPPNLSQVLVDSTDDAVGEWDNTRDITPAGNTKGTQTVACGTVTEVLTKAIYRSVQFGNFMGRAYPEWVETWNANVLAAWARKAEQELLDSMSAASTPVTTAQFHGTTRDLLPYIGDLAAAERNRQRMDPNARFRVLLPRWIIQSITADLMRQGDVPFQVVTEADVRSWLSVLGVNVAFYEDQRTGSGQIVSSQGAGNDLRNLPTTVEWYLFHEGAFQFLDGGTLDLGLVRDSTLNNTNDFRLFAESWEGLAFRGIFSYRVRSAICPSGQAQATVDESSGICAAS